MSEQLQFFASLDFPNRTTVMVGEMADRIGVSCRHLENEIDNGALVALDVKGARSSKRALRIPVECYRDYILQRLTAPVDMRMRFLRDLPPHTRRQLIEELCNSLK